MSLDTPIDYVYLTHETVLPVLPSFPEKNERSLDPPDLRPYESPFNWPESRKTFTTCLSCIVTVVTAYTAGAYSPPSQQMSEYWDVGHVAILVGITTFTTGFAVAPMVLAPFSELNGRRPVFIGTGILFVICQLCCAVTRSYVSKSTPSNYKTKLADSIATREECSQHVSSEVLEVAPSQRWWVV